MTYRLVVKEVAMNHGVYATFMPKPIFGQNGNGMHVHQSLFKGERNAFYDPNEKHQLSDIGKKYIAGLMAHVPEITLVLNQWVNSYKRLVPGYEAPVYISWAMRNRSDMIRIPGYRPGKEEATRVELRSPDPACNPYLAFAAMLAAGLEGIEKDYKLQEPYEGNIYELSETERMELGIQMLPEDLYEAIKLAEKSELMRRTLGDHVYEKLIENKKVEWARFKAQVTSYEIEQYLPIL
jgi:glutamine synthetase